MFHLYILTALFTDLDDGNNPPDEQPLLLEKNLPTNRQTKQMPGMGGGEAGGRGGALSGHSWYAHRMATLGTR